MGVVLYIFFKLGVIVWGYTWVQKGHICWGGSQVAQIS